MLLELYRDWGAENLFSSATRDPTEKEDERDLMATGGSAMFGANGSARKKENVWRRAARLPVTKSGVREALARIGGDGGDQGAGSTM